MSTEKKTRIIDQLSPGFQAQLRKEFLEELEEANQEKKKPEAKPEATKEMIDKVLRRM